MGRDARENVWCYELPSGQRIRLDRDHVRARGAEELVRSLGLDPGPPGQMLPVYQGTRKIGQLPASFDPECARSTCALFSVRPGDFRREGDRWIACRSLGSGDLGSLAEFVPDGDPAHYAPAELTAEEEAALRGGSIAQGIEAHLKRVLGR
jgi:hypothetical protein